MVKNKGKGKNNRNWLSKLEMWEKGAIVGAIWGLFSITSLFAGGVGWLATLWGVIEQVSVHLFSIVIFPFYIAMSIVPAHGGIWAINFLVILVVPAFIGAAIGAGIGYMVDMFKE